MEREEKQYTCGNVYTLSDTMTLTPIEQNKDREEMGQ